MAEMEITVNYLGNNAMVKRMKKVSPAFKSLVYRFVNLERVLSSAKNSKKNNLHSVRKNLKTKIQTEITAFQHDRQLWLQENGGSAIVPATISERDRKKRKNSFKSRHTKWSREKITSTM